MSNPQLVSTKEMDFLDEDKPIRGQNYTLLSFLSPEDVLADKEVFYFAKFMEQFSKDTKELFERMKEKYPDDASMINAVMDNHSQLFDAKDLEDHYKAYKGIHGADIEKEFHEKNNFRTTVRGIKVRGVFDTIQEAKARAELLKKMDNKFDIFLAQVGCWCPWSPNPEELAETEYAETQLNTLMREYKNNAAARDELFEQRKQQKIDNAAKELESKKNELASVMEEKDPWTAAHGDN